MSAHDALHPVQFAGKADLSDSDRDKAREYDAKGSDESEEFGYSDYDMADYQYERYGRNETDTRPQREVF